MPALDSKQGNQDHTPSQLSRSHTASRYTDRLHAHPVPRVTRVMDPWEGACGGGCPHRVWVGRALQPGERAQAVFGLERLVDRTIARRMPAAAYGTSFALRFANNVVGGENFIDMARWAGIQ